MVYRELATHDELSRQELCERLQLEPGALDFPLARLRDRGILIEKDDLFDRRRSLYQLTEDPESV